jgi:hypothetical protein
MHHGQNIRPMPIAKRAVLDVAGGVRGAVGSTKDEWGCLPSPALFGPWWRLCIANAGWRSSLCSLPFPDGWCPRGVVAAGTLGRCACVSAYGQLSAGAVPQAPPPLISQAIDESQLTVFKFNLGQFVDSALLLRISDSTRVGFSFASPGIPSTVGNRPSGFGLRVAADDVFASSPQSGLAWSR